MKQILRFGSSLRALRFVLLACLASLSLQGWAISRATITAINASPGKGFVYVNDAETDNPDWQSSQSSKENYDGWAIRKTHQFYLYAKAEDGYIFNGWYSDSDCKTLVSPVSSWQPTITGSTGGTSATYYAKFIERPAVTYYAQLNIVAGEGGVVSMDDSEFGFSATSEVKSDNTTTIQFSLKAESQNTMYEFEGWYTDPEMTNRISTFATFTYGLESSSTDEANPTIVTLYAKFQTGGSTYNSTATANAVGGGKVYVAYWDKKTPDDALYQTQSSLKQSAFGTGIQYTDMTYYLYAKADAGYRFAGWYTKEACTGSAVSEASPYSVVVQTALRGKESQYYALFLKECNTLAELNEAFTAQNAQVFINNARVQVVQAQGDAPDAFVCEGNQENHTFIVGASCLKGIDSGKWVTITGKLQYDKCGNWTWANKEGCSLATVGEPEDGTYTPRTLTAEPNEDDLFQYVKMQNVRKVDNVLVFGDGKKKIEKEQWWWGDYDDALYDEIYGVVASNNETAPWKELQICSGTKAAQQTETINISEAAGFATYAAPFNAEITRNGAEVWYVSGWSATALTFTKYEETTLKAGEGVLLKQVKQGNTSVTFTPTNDECQALAGNKLKGNIVPTAFEKGEEIFILSNGDNGVGFYPNAPGTLKAGKAYLLRSEWEAAIGSAIGAFQMLFDDDETGIGNVNENVNENQSIYNLAGQRIAGLQKGINIVNGKKILK